jgi:hypothetical protein
MGIETMFANTDTGLWPLEATTGTPILGGPLNSASVNAGNGRGIDLDPISAPTNHVVYLGADCDPAMRPTAVRVHAVGLRLAACRLTQAFARFHRSADRDIREPVLRPDVAARFVSYRDSAAGTAGSRSHPPPAALLGQQKRHRDSQLVRRSR